MPAQDKMAGVYADDVECACQEGAKNEGTRPTDRHNFFVDAVDIFDEICNEKEASLFTESSGRSIHPRAKVGLS